MLLEKIHDEKYLEIYISQELKWSKHFAYTVLSSNHDY